MAGATPRPCEIAARGYQGCRGTVRRFLNSLAQHNGSRPTSPPPPAAACRLARSFAVILRWREGHRLNEWCTQAEEHEVKEARAFANGLRKDLAAVVAGRTLPLGSGGVEVNVTRIELLKRQHSGRAGFDLRRRRILLAH
ncbi:hypothetical protein ACIQU6_15195 [Streptomyces sp. NPDC090442]|uniref:hypothetical protein n=1 Tax=Streptomyces sp. NPDC090442 TaxID=3365962 RepID=UPI003812EB6C